MKLIPRERETASLVKLLEINAYELVIQGEKKRLGKFLCISSLEITNATILLNDAE